MKSFFLSRIRSFGYAFRGWWHVIKHPAKRMDTFHRHHCCCHRGLWLGLPARDWAVLLLTIAMVWAAEFFNTAIEAVVDLASPAKHPLAKVGKDVGAAAVLIAALAAIGVGLLILGPPLWEEIGGRFGGHAQVTRSEELPSRGWNCIPGKVRLVNGNIPSWWAQTGIKRWMKFRRRRLILEMSRKQLGRWP